VLIEQIQDASMKIVIASMLLMVAFGGVAESASKAKPNLKKQTMKVRCKPGYMFERDKCVIIPDMENTSLRH
jgi:Spy/CpxP family protein refolding chaperone